MDIKPQMNLLAYSVTQTPPVRQDTLEASEPTPGPDNDRDGDDPNRSPTVNRAPAVNAMGETVGRIINSVA
ncbi:MAG: hypothetical protein P8171_17795 [Candidatus Thiodiazotropha sp.]|jgi:hypothetical protein